MDNFFKAKRLEVVTCLFLIAVSLSVYGQMINHDFVDYDDPKYVTGNRQVQAGLTRQGVVWALTTTTVANWHPLTWLSHMLDCELYGMNPMGHHWTSLLFHVANSLLLFYIFQQMTGAIWQSALVAALFALHPLHVESVAWVAERKDVLSTFFGMLTMLVYLRYVKHPGCVNYLLVFLFFTLGLISKPMLVTLPFVLLLLDFWPLQRFQYKEETPTPYRGERFDRQVFLKLIGEKFPLIVLAVVSSVLTYIVQSGGGGVKSFESFPLNVRISNAFVSYVSYIIKTVWPYSLAVFYPHPAETLPVWKIFGAVLLIIGITFLAVRKSKQYPYVAVGWFWYIGTLVPVIGFVQVGSQAMADRYSYIPLIGLFIMIAWGISDLSLKWNYRKVLLPVAVGMILLALAVRTFFQVGHWKDTITLFENAVRVTDNNGPAHNNLGNALSAQGEFEKAHFHLQTALEINPGDAMVVFNLGKNRYDQGNIEQAMDYYKKALKINPGHAGAHNNLANLLADKGKIDEAVSHFQAALRTKPGFSDAHNNLAIAYSAQGKIDKAVSHLTKALKINPEDPATHVIFGNLLMAQGKFNEAMFYFAEAVRITPDNAEAYDFIGLILTRQGKFEGAEIFFSKAIQINPHFSKARKHLEENRNKISNKRMLKNQ